MLSFALVAARQFDLGLPELFGSGFPGVCCAAFVGSARLQLVVRLRGTGHMAALVPTLLLRHSFLHCRSQLFRVHARPSLDGFEALSVAYAAALKHRRSALQGCCPLLYAWVDRLLCCAHALNLRAHRTSHALVEIFQPPGANR